MAAKDFIVAIELGSSKVTGIAGKKNLDGSINVLAVATVKVDSSLFIRKGVVYNIDKAAQCLTTIVNKLKQQLKTDISRVCVGVGGQSIRSVRNTIAIDLPPETKVTQEMVTKIMDENRGMMYPNQEILDAAVQEYKVDAQLQTDPVGILCSRLEGNFLNILGRKDFSTKLNDCFKTAGINISEMYLTPIALADSVLTEAEKRSGCVLVDLGADTTTVSVYTKNILRHVAVIPLGMHNITKDIASLQMEEADAEKMKLKYASAFTENSEIDSTLMLPIDADRSVEMSKFVEIVEGRLDEIIENVWYQVPTEYTDKLLGGMIITGGGANMKNIERAFSNHTQMDKIRIARTVNFTVNSSNADINAKNCMMCTVLGLLAKGEVNCAGGELDDSGDLFATKPQPQPQPAEQQVKVRQPHEKPIGEVLTEAEKEEARRRKEEEERLQREREEEEHERLEREKRENSPMNKFFKKLKAFGQQIIEDDEH